MRLDDSIEIDTCDLVVGTDPYNPDNVIYDWQERGSVPAQVFYMTASLQTTPSSVDSIRITEQARAIIEVPSFPVVAAITRVRWNGIGYQVDGVLQRNRGNVVHHLTLLLERG